MGTRKPVSPTAPRTEKAATYRLYADQANGLALAATMRRIRSGGSGRADHSGILREILDAVAAGAAIDEDIQKALIQARDASEE